MAVDTVESGWNAVAARGMEGGPRLLVAAGCAIAAALLALYLAAASWGGESVAGCGATSGCDAALSSAWSRWLGVPVSLMAVVVYVLMAVAAAGAWSAPDHRVRQAAWMGLLFTVGVIPPAAVWFLIVMLTKLDAACPYCTAVHALGLLGSAVVVAEWRRLKRSDRSVARRRGVDFSAIAVGMMAAGALIGGQVLRPVETFQVVLLPSPAQTTLAAAVADMSSAAEESTLVAGSESGVADGASDWTPYASGTGADRQITPTHTEMTLPLPDLPLIGPRDARHIILFLGDYRCEHCRRMHAMLSAVVQRYAGEVAYAVLPFPLNRRCNAWMPEGAEKDRYNRSCEVARLALAVHRADPAMFAVWDEWMTEYGGTPPLSGAVEKAVALVGREALDQALSDPWIEQQLQRNVSLFMALPHDIRNTVPVLMMEGSYVKGAPDGLSQLYALLEDRLGLTAAQP